MDYLDKIQIIIIIFIIGLLLSLVYIGIQSENEREAEEIFCNEKGGEYFKMIGIGTPICLFVDNENKIAKRFKIEKVNDRYYFID